MTRKIALDDPEISRIAWARYRRFMSWMALLGVICVVGVLGWLWLKGFPLPIHVVIATFLGVWLTVMLGTGLMALAFLSSGTGHDEQVQDRISEMVNIDD